MYRRPSLAKIETRGEIVTARETDIKWPEKQDLSEICSHIAFLLYVVTHTEISRNLELDSKRSGPQTALLECCLAKLLSLIDNLLLWGCKAWSLRKSLLMKLEVFLTRNIRRILKISMFQVKRERITNDQVRKRFYDIPCVENMIAARLLSFIGKAVRDPCPLRPAKLMLTTCCNNNRKRGRPYTTNKDTIVNCLVLLFERVPEVAIDQNQGSMIDWVKEVNNEKYWKSLIRCLLKSDEEIPTRPTDEGWNQTPRPQPQPAPCPTPERRRQRRQRSTRRTRPNQSSNSNPPPPPGSPPQGRQQAPPPPPSPRRDREPPPQRAEHRERDWIAANVGKVRYDSLRILGLREGATEGEVKAAYWAMSRIYHPDKHNSGFIGMSDEEAVEFFQHLNNAHSYLREIM